MPNWIVCGGRDYADAECVFRTLREQMKQSFFNPTIVQGGAPGADALARLWAHENGVPYIEVRADWNKYGRAAGPIRNQRMLDEHRPERVIAFPGGRGTADMIRRAEAAGVPVVRIYGEASGLRHAPRKLGYGFAKG